VPVRFTTIRDAGNGYVVTYSNLRIYVAGDTEDIPEMRALQNIDVAFVPMNLPYTMTPKKLHKQSAPFIPKIVTPITIRDPIRRPRGSHSAGSMIDVRLRTGTSGTCRAVYDRRQSSCM